MNISQFECTRDLVLEFLSSLRQGRYRGADLHARFCNIYGLDSHECTKSRFYALARQVFEDTPDLGAAGRDKSSVVLYVTGRPRNRRPRSYSPPY